MDGSKRLPPSCAEHTVALRAREEGQQKGLVAHVVPLLGRGGGGDPVVGDDDRQPEAIPEQRAQSACDGGVQQHVVHKPRLAKELARLVEVLADAAAQLVREGAGPLVDLGRHDAVLVCSGFFETDCRRLPNGIWSGDEWGRVGWCRGRDARCARR